MKNLTTAICLLVTPFLLAEAATNVRLKVYAEPCLPSSEFALSGLKLNQSESVARKILGKPRRVTREKGEDDGGAYTATVLHYGHMKVEIVRGVVDRLHTDSSRGSTPSGVRPGMRFEDVKKVLGKGPKAIDGCSNCYRACDESEPAYFALKFDSNMVLSSIDIGADRP